MITFGAPLFLGVGAALAVTVTVLHFLSPRPPEPAPLPTARFLRAAPRDRIRWQRRPADGAVLLLRIVVALLLGALFSSPRWTARLEPGSTRVVLLDGGLGMADRWASAIAAAEDRVAGAVDVRGVLFDAAGWREVSREEWSALPAPLLGGGTGADSTLPSPGSGSSGSDGSYLVALRALRAIAAEVGTTEMEAELVTHARWGAWDAALGALRPFAWPGRIRVVSVPSSNATPIPSVAPGPREAASPDRAGAVARRTGATPPLVVAALHALGYEVGPQARRLQVLDVGDAALVAALDAAGTGDTVVVAGAGEVGPGQRVLADLWDAEGWPSGDLNGAIHVGRRTVDVEQDDVVVLSGSAAVSGRGRALAVVAADGRPLASATRHGDGCVVRYGAPLAAGASDPDFPHLVRTLADGCRPDGAGADATPLDAAALSVLAGEGAERVLTAGVRTGAGTPIEGWLLLVLAAAAVAETLLVARFGRNQR
jgi:hypothetical protein